MMTIVRIEDCKKLGFCNHGLREMAQRNNLDWYDFLENGISAERLLAIDPNDTNILQVIEIAKERERLNGR